VEDKNTILPYIYLVIGTSENVGPQKLRAKEGFI